ncbi:RloB family protein [Anabaena sp. CCY 9910]|uniref:RloB family protein n=1 Tax=Anabaena sp. CCY 9910 TaxID=3103870 RepID=UPI0039E000FA
MAKKKHRQLGYSPRKVDIKEIRQRFLIVCEGQKTEPNYFRSFRVPKVVIDVQGLGINPTGLVDRAKELRSQGEYDQIWCVFDRDSWTEQDFCFAIKSANDEGIRIAYSNESFELWYILHFEFLDTGVSRSDYLRKLTALLGYQYSKNSESIYDELLSKQQKAIRNAENLLNQYSPCNPVKDNPSTTVHLLVLELNKFIR